MNRLQSLVHGRNLEERRRYIRALSESSDPQQRQRAAKMELCGCSGQFVLPEDRPGYIRIDRCGRRLCPLCAKLRAARCRRKIESLLKGEERVRHIVLTMKGTGEVLHEQIRKIMSYFGRLRRIPRCKVRLQGGLYVIEVARKADAADWHVHLHVLYVGLYYPQRELATDWSAVVGCDSIVWISFANERHASYLAKYIGAPDKLAFNDDAMIREYEASIHSKRMIQCFGTWHDKKIDGEDEKPAAVKSAEAVSLIRLVIAADNGHRGAIRILSVLSIRYPFLRSSHWECVKFHPPPSRKELSHAIDKELERCCRFVREYRNDWQPFRPRRHSTGEDDAM